MIVDAMCHELALHFLGDGELFDSDRHCVQLEPKHVEPAADRLAECIQRTLERELAAIADEIRAERSTGRRRA